MDLTTTTLLLLTWMAVTFARAFTAELLNAMAARCVQWLLRKPPKGRAGLPPRPPRGRQKLQAEAARAPTRALATRVRGSVNLQDR